MTTVIPRWEWHTFGDRSGRAEDAFAATLDRAEVDRRIDTYRFVDAEGRRAIIGLQPQRAEVILAGACIVRTIMDQQGHGRLTVSDRGLRRGVPAERFTARAEGDRP